MLTLKKSLGQHFLKDEEVSKRIAGILQERPFGRLLEIGPGGGALTKYLLSFPDIDLKCIEIDREKVQYLLRVYPQLKGKIIEADILDVAKPFDRPFTVVGNFPYNISTEILFKMLDWKDELESVTGMFQREVAQRVAAVEGSKIYGVTSVLLQAFFRVEYLFEVPATAFEPPPKVQSAVIRLTPLAEPVTMRNAKLFRVLVKTAFNQRRKTLRNAVKGLFTKEELADGLFDKRAEQLSVEEFGRLTFRMREG
jgi:16S rRNA (adenine1518-N6/adenine1519-N6)-dimethyltransferase